MVQLAPLFVLVAVLWIAVDAPLAERHPDGLVGCYELARSYDGSAPTSNGAGGLNHGRWYGDVEKIRCFAGGAGFLERRTVTFASPAGSAYRQSAHAGTWSTEGRKLTLQYEDGDAGEWELEAFEGGVQIGDELWRTLDLEPETLKAEVEDADDSDDAGDQDDADDPDDEGDAEAAEAAHDEVEADDAEHVNDPGSPDDDDAD